MNVGGIDDSCSGSRTLAQRAMARVVEVVAGVEASGSGSGSVGVVGVEDIEEETDQSRIQGRR